MLRADDPLLHDPQLAPHIRLAAQQLPLSAGKLHANYRQITIDARVGERLQRR
jgi:hypothetical protein